MSVYTQAAVCVSRPVPNRVPRRARRSPRARNGRVVVLTVRADVMAVVRSVMRPGETLRIESPTRVVLLHEGSRA